MTAAMQGVRKGVAKSLDKVERTFSGSVAFVIVTVLSALLFAVNLFLTYLAANPTLSKGLFLRGISEVSANFPLNITPAGFTFAIWGVIYLLQTGWILYSLGLLCRSVDGQPAYLAAPVLSPAFFLYFCGATVSVIVWLFMWDRLLFFAAFVFLALVATCLIMAVITGASNLTKYRAELVDEGRALDVKVLTVTMLNGVSMYATWTVVATIINLGIILVYKLHTSMSNETASIICLSVLSVLVVLYTVLDMSVLKPYTRYNFAPFLTIIWALVGVLSKNLDRERFSSLLSIGLLAATSLVLVAKLVYVGMQYGKDQYEYKQMKFGRSVTPVLETKGEGC